MLLIRLIQSLNCLGQNLHLDALFCLITTLAFLSDRSDYDHLCWGFRLCLSKVTKIHIQCKLARRGSVWLGECYIFYYYPIYWSDTSLGIQTCNNHIETQIRAGICVDYPMQNFLLKIGGFLVVELF